MTPVKDQWRGELVFGTFNHEVPQRCLVHRHWTLVAFVRAAARRLSNLHGSCGRFPQSLLQVEGR